MADPRVRAGWDWPWGPVFNVNFSKGDVNNIIRYHYDWGSLALMGLICTAVGGVNAQAGSACGLIGGFYADSIVSSFRAAYNRDPNNRVFMRFTYTGIAVDWYRCNCDGSTY